MTKNDPNATEKLNNWVGKVASFAIAVVVGIAGIMYNDIKQRTTTLEERVSFLYQDKVSRAEFREEMIQLRQQNDANKTDIIARQETMKSDILARFDLLIPHISRDRKDR